MCYNGYYYWLTHSEKEQQQLMSSANLACYRFKKKLVTMSHDTMRVAEMRHDQATVMETNRSLHGKRIIGLRVSGCPLLTVWWLLTRAALVLPFDGFF